MKVVVARGGAWVESNYILTSKVFLNRLKRRSEIIMCMRVERGSRVTDSEIPTAGLLCQIAKAFGCRTWLEPSIMGRKQRKVNHIKRDAACARGIDNCCISRRTE